MDHVTQYSYTMHRYWLTSHQAIERQETKTYVFTYIYVIRCTHMDESCHTCQRVMSHIWMRHVTFMHELCHTALIYDAPIVIDELNRLLRERGKKSMFSHMFMWHDSLIWMSHVLHSAHIRCPNSDRRAQRPLSTYWHLQVSYVCHLCVSHWLTTHSYVCLLYVCHIGSRLYHMCSSSMCVASAHDSFIYVCRLCVSHWLTTHSYLSVVYVCRIGSRLIHMYVPSMCVALAHVSFICVSPLCVSHMCAMAHDSWICGTRLMTHDSIICGTQLMTRNSLKCATCHQYNMWNHDLWLMQRLTIHDSIRLPLWIM